MLPDPQIALLLFFIVAAGLAALILGANAIRSQSKSSKTSTTLAPNSPTDNPDISAQEDTKHPGNRPAGALENKYVLSGSVGMGSLAGASIAIQYGGPGALAWMWITSIAAISLAYGEIILQQQSPSRSRSESGNIAAKQQPSAMIYLSTLSGVAGRIWPIAFALSSLVFLLLCGGSWQSQQSAVVLEELLGIPPSNSVVIIALIVLLLLTFLRGSWQGVLFRLLPFALAIYLGVIAWLLALQLDSLPEVLESVLNNAWSWDTGFWGAFGSVLPAAFYGLSFSVMGHEAGLGTQFPSIESGRKKILRSTLAPLFHGCLISTLTGFALLASQFPVHERVDHPQLRQDELATLVPFERPHSAGFLPSDAGQLIVLPEDSPLQANTIYPMVFRGSPRGHQVGKLTPKGNGIITLGWKICRTIDTVIFRDSEAKRSNNPAFDLRIPVRQIRLGDAVTPSSIVLVPLDPNVDFQRLASKMDGPYILIDDFYFDAMVVESKINRNDLEKKLAIIEAPGQTDQANPSLIQVVAELGFRGPYFAEAYPKTKDKRPPMTLVSRAGFSPPIGAKINLEMRSPTRGLELGRLRIDGSMETPPWDFLRDINQVLYRHESDPSLDYTVRVVGAIRDGNLRFHSTDPEIGSLEISPSQKSFSGPFLVTPDVKLAVEVRSGDPLPESVLSLSQSPSGSLESPTDIRSLIPLNNSSSSKANRPGFTHNPNAEELIASGMQGPFVYHEGIGQIIGMLKVHLNPFAAGLAGISVLLLAGGTLLNVCKRGQSIANTLLGPGSALGFRICLATAACFGAVMEFSDLVSAMQTLIMTLLVVHLSGFIVLLLARKNTSS